MVNIHLKYKNHIISLICFIIGLCTATLLFVLVQPLIIGNDTNEFNEIQDSDNMPFKTMWVKACPKRIQCYYRKGNSIYWSDALDNDDDKFVPEISGADCETFEIAIGSHYAKDKNKVYWWDYDEDILEYDEWPEGQLSPVVALEGADPKTFKVLGNEFACDQNKMYFEGEEINWDHRDLNPNLYKIIANLYHRFEFDDPCDYLAKKTDNGINDEAKNS